MAYFNSRFRIFWTADGWPFVSPERYAWKDDAAMAKDSLASQWKEYLVKKK